MKQANTVTSSESNLPEVLGRFEKCREALGHENLHPGDIVPKSDDFETLVAYIKAVKEVYENNLEDEVVRGVLPEVDLFRMQVHHVTCTGNTLIWVERDEYGSWSLHATRKDIDHPWNVLREDHLKIMSLAGYTSYTLGPTNSSEVVELEECLKAYRKPSTSTSYTSLELIESNITRLENELTLQAGEILSQSSFQVTLPNYVESDTYFDFEDSEIDFFLACKKEDLYNLFKQCGPTILAYAAQQQATKIGIYWAY